MADLGAVGRNTCHGRRFKRLGGYGRSAKCYRKKRMAFFIRYAAVYNVLLTKYARIGGYSVPVRYEATWAWSDTYKNLFTNTAGNIRGVVLQNTVPIALCAVALYDRLTKVLIAYTKTKSDGTFRFDNQIVGYDKLFIVAFDPDGAPLQNAVILDKLTCT